ncbi:hypothetical protein L1987_69446 [Smallanthus sonchifolius]|uniref:Uncharacterized protein n=1 Tax=Smallanthus sonchifolius TaxID=185202 RepID=A0ACB9B5P0_9ASTR|nr:hypothetical protein L1987_69446 [Smallanthus sonchifolius]
MWKSIWTSGTSTPFHSIPPLTKLKFQILSLENSQMEYTPVTEEQISSQNDVGLIGFVEQEESPKRESSSEWTDEKHSLYLNSMEASFVNNLYNSLDMQCWQNQSEECPSESTSSRKIHATTRCTSGQFKVLHHGFWSRVDFRRESSAHNRPNISSSNPWIQHFRNGNRHGHIESPSPQQKTEVIDQNFVEEDSAIHLMNTACSKKRKGTYAISESGNDQAVASFGHFSYNRNH